MSRAPSPPPSPATATFDRVLYRGRPSPWWIILSWPRSQLFPFLLILAAKMILESAKLPDAARTAELIAWAYIALALLWRLFEWLSRSYTITTREVIIRAGIINRTGADIPLRNVQHATLFETLLEQVLRLGSVGIATAGSDGPVAYLVTIKNPKVVLELLNREVELAQSAPAPLARPSALRPLVIGLAGGIGAGKSAVAAAFARLGALVIDSDKEAKEALDRSEVRAELIRWWGDAVLAPDGRIDRKKVAAIIFTDPAQRQRLERLVHPLVRASRAEMIARADPRTTPAVIVDAPLLFEVGLDKECDAVVFIDAPRDQRLARVQATRGWDEAELEKREKSQLPIEEKRSRADEVIVNDSTLEALTAKAAAAFDRLLNARRRAPAT